MSTRATDALQKSVIEAQTVGAVTAIVGRWTLVAGASYKLSGEAVGQTVIAGVTLTVTIDVAAAVHKTSTGTIGLGVSVPIVLPTAAGLGAATATIVVAAVGGGHEAQLVVTGVAGATVNWLGALRGLEYQP